MDFVAFRYNGGVKVKKQKAYIAGKISGLNHLYAYGKFAFAEMWLHERGYKTVNPMRICPHHWGWYRCMAKCVFSLLFCSHICLLENWHLSKGAKIEIAIAILTGKKLIIQTKKRKK